MSCLRPVQYTPFRSSQYEGDTLYLFTAPGDPLAKETANAAREAGAIGNVNIRHVHIGDPHTEQLTSRYGVKDTQVLRACPSGHTMRLEADSAPITADAIISFASVNVCAPQRMVLRPPYLHCAPKPPSAKHVMVISHHCPYSKDAVEMISKDPVMSDIELLDGPNNIKEQEELGVTHYPQLFKKQPDGKAVAMTKPMTLENVKEFTRV